MDYLRYWSTVQGQQHVHGLSMIYRLLIANTFYMIIYLSEDAWRENTIQGDENPSQLLSVAFWEFM